MDQNRARPYATGAVGSVVVQLCAILKLRAVAVAGGDGPSQRPLLLTTRFFFFLPSLDLYIIAQLNSPDKRRLLEMRQDVYRTWLALTTQAVVSERLLIVRVPSCS